MNHKKNMLYTSLAGCLAVLLFFLSGTAQGKILGESGTTFNLTAKVDYVSIADGGNMLLWGLAIDNGRAQYPAPTLIINQGDVITINLTNYLKDISGQGGPNPNVSLVFPGHEVTTTNCTVAPCVDGDLTLEALRGGQVSYTFTANQPGTYTYHSGTDPGLQVEMGLTGVIIVRPADFNAGAPTAYAHEDTAYDYEELFFLTEMDPRIHQHIQFYGTDPNNQNLRGMLANYFSNYWFINGRTAPDDLSDAEVSWLPTQPYNSVPRMHPGDTVLMRVIGGGRDMHPFHHHGNHAKVIARDGRMLESSPGAGPDIGTEGFTITSEPGKTVDALFTWTGEGMNWDIYGGQDVFEQMPHTCNGIPLTDPADGAQAPQPDNAPKYDPETHEYCADHGKPFPVVLPGNQELAFGGWWGGSPYLGSLGALPPGEGGLNPNGGYSFMWHSHTEKELTNWDIFPGGMLTMMIIEPHGTSIPQ